MGFLVVIHLPSLMLYRLVVSICIIWLTITTLPFVHIHICVFCVILTIKSDCIPLVLCQQTAFPLRNKLNFYLYTTQIQFNRGIFNGTLFFHYS